VLFRFPDPLSRQSASRISPTRPISRLNTLGRSRFQNRCYSSNNSSTTLELAYEEYNPKEGLASTRGPLLILHGLFGSKQNWRSLSKSLTQRLSRKVYALDLRNHGSSPHSVRDGVHTYESMANDVRALVANMGWEDVSVMGHSMGGKVSMALFLSSQSQASASPLSDLIVVDIAPTRGSISEDFKGYLRAMKRIEEMKVGSRKEADKVLEGDGGIKDPSIRAFLLTNLLPITSSSPHAKFRVPLDLIDASLDDLGDFPFGPPSEGGETTWAGPTLMIKGTRSKYINSRNLPVAREFFPNMRLEELDTVHWVHAERPAEFLDLVTGFLSEKR